VVPGRTNIKFPTIGKPCPLAATDSTGFNFYSDNKNIKPIIDHNF
jgi:hypothetical protein